MAQFPANIDLSSLDGSNGFRLIGVTPGDHSGFSVASAGDVNGDGFADVIVGAGGANPDPQGYSSGASYVVFGAASGFAANLELSSLDGSNGFTLNGVAAGDYSGRPVASAGDVNGDGFADLIVGAWSADPHGSASGASYVVFGAASGFAANVALSSLDGSNGFRLSGVAAGDFSGSSVASAGDVNGDGFADLIVGAFFADPHGSASGASYVVFGAASGFAANLDLSSLDGSNGFRLSGVAANDHSGFSVASAGDVNGDGFADLIVGAREADPHGSFSGASYVVFGAASGFAANLDLSSLDGNSGFRLSGVAPGDGSGSSVASAGDVNGDGFADLIVGAPGADPHASGSGASYVVFGAASGFAANLDLSSLDGSNGFRLSGVAAYDYSGVSVASAGDVNGDGFADLIVGAWSADPHGYASGASYVVFGAASGFAANLDLSSLDGSNGFRLSGVAERDYSGNSVASAGDVNGDGFADLIVGAGGAESGPLSRGASYVIYGLAPDVAVNRTGTAASQTLAGGAFDDTVSGFGGNDRLFGNGGDDTLNGGAGNDTLNGGAGNDRLDGRVGADTMAGGAGNDIHYVDNAADKVIEAAGGGIDAVYASVNWTLGAGQQVEYLLVNGSTGRTLAGNELDNLLIGGAGTDALNGGLGNDALDGGAGADTMAGGAGDDTHYVDNAADKVIEAAGGGSDIVYASVNWILGAGQQVEYLLVNGSAGRTLVGNELDNFLLGGAGTDTLNGGLGNDALDGGVGADTMAGGAGDDTHYVDNAADTVIEGAGGGIDTRLCQRQLDAGGGAAGRISGGQRMHWTAAWAPTPWRVAPATTPITSTTRPTR